MDTNELLYLMGCGHPPEMVARPVVYTSGEYEEYGERSQLANIQVPLSGMSD